MSDCCGGKAPGQELELTVQETTPAGVVVNVKDLRAELFRIADTLKTAYDLVLEGELLPEPTEEMRDLYRKLHRLPGAQICFGQDAYDIPRFYDSVHTAVAEALSTLGDVIYQKDGVNHLTVSKSAPTTASTVKIDDLIACLQCTLFPGPQRSDILNVIMLAQLWTPLTNRVAKIMA